MTCRLCLKRDQNSKTFEGTKIIKKIKECLSIDVMDCEKLPTKICSNCHDLLEKFWSFRHASLLADRILRNALQNNTLYIFMEETATETKVKREVNDDNVELIDSTGYSDVKTNNIVTVEEVDCNDTYEEIKFRYAPKGNSLDSVEEHIIFEVDNQEMNAELREEDVDNEILKVEKENNFDEDQELVICNVCDEVFHSQDEYNTHNISHDLKCNTCDQVFDTRKQVLEHVKNHQVECPICSKSMLKSSLNLHIIRHTDRYKCPLCPTRSTCRSSYDNHMASVHHKIKNNFCKLCGKGFSTISLLNLHLKSHSEERPYKCKLCLYGGRTASALTRHMDKHAERIHMCDMCPKMFKSNLSLNHHKKSFHLKERKHICSECGKRFYTKYKLGCHMRSHTGDKPYVCEVCGRSFVRRDGLNEHMSTHSNLYFSCGKCNKNFTCKRSIKRHICT